MEVFHRFAEPSTTAFSVLSRILSATRFSDEPLMRMPAALDFRVLRVMVFSSEPARRLIAVPEQPVMLFSLMLPTLAPVRVIPSVQPSIVLSVMRKPLDGLLGRRESLLRSSRLTPDRMEEGVPDRVI